MRRTMAAQTGLALLATLLSVLAAPSARAGAPEPTYFLGDVNCDGSIDSIDAALLLQLEAALLDELPCAGNADMDADGSANSIDAGLVLQYTAGLIDSRVQFSLNVTRPAGLCDDAQKPAVCNVPAGTEFGLSIVLNHPPPEGYITFQTELYYGDLRYNTTTYSDEEVDWPDSGLPARHVEEGGGFVAHGALSSSGPPFRVSRHRGSLVSLSMSCPLDPQAFGLALVGLDPMVSPLGASVNVPDESVLPPIMVGQLVRDFYGQSITVPVAARLQINCVE